MSAVEVINNLLSDLHVSVSDFFFHAAEGHSSALPKLFFVTL